MIKAFVIFAVGSASTVADLVRRLSMLLERMKVWILPAAMLFVRYLISFVAQQVLLKCANISSGRRFFSKNICPVQKKRKILNIYENPNIKTSSHFLCHYVVVPMSRTSWQAFKQIEEIDWCLLYFYFVFGTMRAFYHLCKCARKNRSIRLSDITLAFYCIRIFYDNFKG